MSRDTELIDFVSEFGEDCYRVLPIRLEQKNGSMVNCQVFNFLELLDTPKNQSIRNTRIYNSKFAKKPFLIDFGVRYNGDFKLEDDDVSLIIPGAEISGSFETLFLQISKFSPADVALPLFSAIFSVIFIATGYWFLHKNWQFLLFKVIFPSLAVQPSAVIWYHYRSGLYLKCHGVPAKQLCYDNTF